VHAVTPHVRLDLEFVPRGMSFLFASSLADAGIDPLQDEVGDLVITNR
jgi:hypothetical protein